MSREPSTYWLIVEFEAENGKEDAGQYDQCCHPKALAQGVYLIIDKPSVEDVHDRVVHDVERIGEVAKGFVDAMGRLVSFSDTATGTEPHEHGEDEGYTSKLIQAVEVDRSR